MNLTIDETNMLSEDELDEVCGGRFVHRGHIVGSFRGEVYKGFKWRPKKCRRGHRVQRWLKAGRCVAIPA